MAVHIFDLDGTLVLHGTNTPLPGARSLLAELRELGHKIIIMTRRGVEFMDSPQYGVESIPIALRALKLPLSTIVLQGCDSPRILHNDEGCEVVRRVTNQPWGDTP